MPTWVPPGLVPLARVAARGVLEEGHAANARIALAEQADGQQRIKERVPSFSEAVTFAARRVGWYLQDAGVVTDRRPIGRYADPALVPAWLGHVVAFYPTFVLARFARLGFIETGKAVNPASDYAKLARRENSEMVKALGRLRVAQTRRPIRFRQEAETTRHSARRRGPRPNRTRRARARGWARGDPSGSDADLDLAARSYSRLSGLARGGRTW